MRLSFTGSEGAQHPAESARLCDNAFASFAGS
jgi:hypothetical protein